MNIHISLKALEALNGVWYFISIFVATAVGLIYGSSESNKRWPLYCVYGTLGLGFLVISLAMGIASEGCGG